MDSGAATASSEGEAPVSPVWTGLRLLSSVAAIAGILGTGSFLVLRGTLYQKGFEKGSEWIHETPGLLLYAIEGLLILGLLLRGVSWVGRTGLWLPPEERRAIRRPRFLRRHGFVSAMWRKR